MSIYVTHGIVRKWDATAFADRNMLDHDAFAWHLKRRCAKYVSVHEAHRGCGDALTVDDSTSAAAQACRVARDLGHEVTFFINPSNVLEQREYFFARLDTALDRCRSTRSFGELQRFRRRTKEKLLQQNSDVAVERVVDGACAELGTTGDDVAPGFRIVDVDVLRDLVARGVHIGSHGWSHLEIASLSDREFSQHVRRASEWIADTLRQPATAYAVPFGETPLSPTREREVGTPWFLARDSADDRLAGQGADRRTLVLGGAD